MEEQIDAVLELMEQQKEQETDLNEDDKLDLLKQAAKAKKAFDDLEEEEKEQIDPDKIEEFLEFVDSLEIQTPDNADGQEQPDSPSTPANPPQIDTETPDRPQTNLDNTQNQTQTGDTATSSEFVEDPDTPTLSNGSGQNQTVPSSTTTQPSQPDNSQPDNKETNADALKPSEEDKPNLSKQVNAARRSSDLLKEEEQNQIEEDNENNTSFDSVDTSNIQALSDETDTNPITGMKIVTAEIWAKGKTNQSLLKGSSSSESSSETTSFSVDFSKQFTLHLVVDSELNLQNKKVEITVPDGLTVVEYPIPDRGGMVNSVEYQESTTSYGGYQPENGIITYSLRDTAETNSFNIILAPDTTLWNRSMQQQLNKKLQIKVYTDGTNTKEYQTVSATPTITGQYETQSRALRTGPRLSKVGVKNGVPTNTVEPFSLRQIWLNPDKDYIEMTSFFKALELTIALPYYEQDDERVYATFDHMSYDSYGTSTRKNLMDPQNHKNGDDSYKDGFQFTQTTDSSAHTVTLTWENLYLEYASEFFTPWFKWENGKAPNDGATVHWENDKIFVNKDNYTTSLPTGKGAVMGKITWEDDTFCYPLSQFNKDVTPYTAYAGERMKITGQKVDKGLYQNFDSNAIYCLGLFKVVNHGGQTSAEQTVEFTYNNTDTFGVTAQKIPAGTSNTGIEVWYKTTTQTRDTWTKYNGTLESPDGFALFTTQMAKLEKNEYFTAIKANVGSYERDYVGYVATRDKDPTSNKGATFGKLLKANVASNTPYTQVGTMKMNNTNDPSSDSTSGWYDVTVVENPGQIPLAMEQAYDPTSDDPTTRLPILSDPVSGEEKSAAVGGDTVRFNALISASAYPNSNVNFITDPVIYIRLPNEVTIKNGSLELFQEMGRTADKVFLNDMITETAKPKREKIPEGTPTKVDPYQKNGYTLYKIDLTSKAKVGWFTEDLTQYQIAVSFDMEIAKDTDAMILNMRDCVRVQSKSIPGLYDLSATLYQCQVFDTEDWNKNEKTDKTDLFSTFNVNTENTTAKLSVIAKRQGLTYTFGARQVEKGSDPSWDPADFTNYDPEYNPAMRQRLYLKDENHVIALLFTLKNETGRVFPKEDAQAFYYYIPVPKEGDLWDVHMQEKAFEFDMNLTGEPKLDGPSANHIKVTYAVDIDSKAKSGESKHFTNLDNYITKNKLLEGLSSEADQLAQWAKVKMIRIAASESVETIPENAELKVNLRLEPSFKADQEHFDSMADLVGKVVSFGPCGVAPYSVGQTTNQGHNPLPKFRAEFQTGVIAGKIFIDKNFNGVYDKDIDELYTTDKVSVKTQHQNGTADNTEPQDATVNAPNTTDENKGTFKLNRRRADTYIVTVTNPGSTNANDKNPLKFSLEEGGKFSEKDNGSKATTTLVLDSDKDSNDTHVAQNLMIGLQQPHKVTFTAENADLKLANVSESSTPTTSLAEIRGNSDSDISRNVWHQDTLGANNIPTVTANNGYRFTGKWTTADGKTYTTDQLKMLEINEDTTITAEVKQLYTLTYDGNGSTKGEVPGESQHIAQQTVTLANFADLSWGNQTVCVGWSRDRIEKTLPADASQDLIDKIITGDMFEMPADNVTLYAVYAVDANNNGNPDYRDDAVHVRYHGNNKSSQDIICPHHHVVGETAQLSTNGTVTGKMINHTDSASVQGEQKDHFTFTYNNHIFAGWSITLMPDVITTNKQYLDLKDSIVTAVTMADKDNADNDGNTNVYAVWAADRNNNKVADYEEECKLIYNGNPQQSGQVNNVPQDATPHLPNDKVTLSQASAPAHSNVDDKTVLFLGWTAQPTTKIYSRADNAPATIDMVCFTSEDKTVYAAWGYDENGNGRADVLETYTLSYDLNGGKETAPAMVINLNKNAMVELTPDTNFTRNANEIFVGWSDTKHETALALNADKDEVNKFLISPGGTYHITAADVTLYAVWAVDVNNNHKPDYDERYSLTYDGNAQADSAPVENLPTISNKYAPGSKVTLATGKPTHSKIDGKTVVFIGWTEQKTNKIYDRTGTAPETITEVTIADSDVTVYAAWGYDENNNNTADYDETHTLTYDANAQASSTVTGTPTDMTKRYIPREKVTLDTAKPTHSKVNGKTVAFLGWTAQKTNKIYSRTDTAPDTIVEITFDNADVTVYAAWGYDENNNNTADCAESRSLTYDGNAQASGTVTETPTDTKRYIPGEKVTLDTAKPTHSEVNGKKVLFLGWAAQKTNKIYSRTDTVPDTLTEVTFDNADVTVYAAWGYDEDNDGTADVLETYTLTYDLNGGKGTAPEKVLDIPKNTEISLSNEKNFTRNSNEIFVGWSETKRAAALTADEKEEKVNQFLLLPGTKYRMGPEDMTLYAVWALDANSDGIPDHQAVYTVAYNLNGGTGASGVSYAKKQVKPGDTVTVKAAPTRSGYTFTGWFDGEKNYQPGEKITVLNADLALTAQWKKNTDSTVLTNVTTPINPNTPTNTTLSNRPTHTTTSNNPTNITTSNKPTNTTTSNKADKTKNDPPQTGNETNLVLWLTILGISFMSLIVGWLGIKRNFGTN